MKHMLRLSQNIYNKKKEAITIDSLFKNPYLYNSLTKTKLMNKEKTEVLSIPMEWGHMRVRVPIEVSEKLPLKMQENPEMSMSDALIIVMGDLHNSQQKSEQNIYEITYQNQETKKDWYTPSSIEHQRKICHWHLRISFLRLVTSHFEEIDTKSPMFYDKLNYVISHVHDMFISDLDRYSEMFLLPEYLMREVVEDLTKEINIYFSNI